MSRQTRYCTSKNQSSLKRLTRRLFCATWFCVLFCNSIFGQNAPPETLSRPAKQIDLSNLGFHGLPPLERFTLRGNVTVHFLDREHVLVSFDARKLMKRVPETATGHQDRMIRAEVIDVASASISRQTEWYVHDKRRYLWPLTSGKLLLRKLNSLYEIDSELNEKLLITFPSELLWVDTSPDGKHIVVETALPVSGESKNAASGKAVIAQKRARVKLDYLDAATLTVERSLLASGSLELNTSGSGYADYVRSSHGGVWLVRFGVDQEQRRPVARVKSPCTPDLRFATENTVFIGRCSKGSTAYSASFFSVTGHPLWRQRWDQVQHFPMIARSEDGGRIAIGTVTAARDSNSEASASNSDEAEEDTPPWPDVEQEIRVVETASGKAVLSTRVKTVVLNNPTFALAPQGDRLGALDGTMLNIFDLPALSQEERAKFVALAAGTPELSAPTAISQPSSQDDLVEDEESANDRTETEFEASATPETTTPKSQSASVQTSLVGPDTREAQRSTTLKVGTNEVEVDVVVTDARGHPVRGLSAGDFKIQEDGRLEKMRYFHEFASVATGAAPTSSVPTPSTPVPANVFSNKVASGPDRALVAVLLDFVNTPLESQQYAKEELLKFLRKKPAGLQLALFALGERLEMLHGFTADENLLLATVNNKKSTARFSRQLSPTIDLTSLISVNKERAAMDASNQVAVQHLEHLQAEIRAGDLDRRVHLTMEAFSELARYLAGMPGRKNVVWLSGAFPRGFFPSMGSDVDAPNGFPAEVRTYEEQLKQITNRLAEVHAAVYPVDVRGNFGDSIYNSETNANPVAAAAPGSQAQGPPGRTPGTPYAGTTTAMGIQSQSELQQQYTASRDSRAAEQAAMDDMAEATGGKAFYNTNGIQAAVETAVEQGSEYYMFSYSPDNVKFDGGFRKIRVSLEKKGYHLAYRRGYFANPRETADRNRAEIAQELGNAALQPAIPQSHELLFSARVVPVGTPVRREIAQANEPGNSTPKKSAEIQRYAIDYAVGGAQLSYVTKDEARHVVLDFMASAFADDGSSIARTAVQTNSDLKPGAYDDVLAGGLRMHQEVDVPVSAVTLRLGVMDEVARHLGTLELPLPLKAPAEETAKSRKLPPIEPD